MGGKIHKLQRERMAAYVVKETIIEVLFDIGWSIAYAGRGGYPDEWIEGFQFLPE